MSQKSTTQPEIPSQTHFVDHCSHLTFLQGENEIVPEDEFYSHPFVKHVDENGSTVISGPGNCYRSNQTI
jgi:hypothetical protein